MNEGLLVLPAAVFGNKPVSSENGMPFWRAIHWGIVMKSDPLSRRKGNGMKRPSSA